MSGPPLCSWPVECRKRGPVRPSSPPGGGRAAPPAPARARRPPRRRGRRRPDGHVVAGRSVASRSPAGSTASSGGPRASRRCRLGGGDVGLVEGLDAQRRADERRGQLHQQHLPAEVGEVPAERQHDDGVPVGRQRLQRLATRALPEATTAGRRRRPRAAQRLAHHRHDACRPLPVDSAISCRATGRRWRRPRHGDGQLVPARAHAGGDRRGQAGGRVGRPAARRRSAMDEAEASSGSTSTPAASAGTSPNSDSAE